MAFFSQQSKNNSKECNVRIEFIFQHFFERTEAYILMIRESVRWVASDKKWWENGGEFSKFKALDFVCLPRHKILFQSNNPVLIICTFHSLNEWWWKKFLNISESQFCIVNLEWPFLSICIMRIILYRKYIITIIYSCYKFKMTQIYFLKILEIRSM